MAKLDTAERKAIPRGDFAVPSKAPGSGSYPIEDKSHAMNALARSSGKTVSAQVRAAVHKKYPHLGDPDKVSEDSDTPAEMAADKKKGVKENESDDKKSAVRKKYPHMAAALGE